MERYATRTAFPKSSNTCVKSIPAELPLKKSPMDRARVKKNAHNPGDSTEVTMNTLRAEIIDKTIGLPWPYAFVQRCPCSAAKRASGGGPLARNELQQLVRHFSIPCTAWGCLQFAG